MARLIALRGLPGSGKSTYADAWREQDPASRVVVNRDDIREMLFGAEYGLPDHESEKLVTRVQREAITGALKAGKDVMSSDTNLRLRTLRELRRIAMLTGADFAVDDSCTKVPLEVCLERNARRTDKKPVPQRVIIQMHDKFVKNGLPDLPDDDPMLADPEDGDYGVEPVTRVAGVPRAFIFDIDGTLAHTTGRGPFEYDRVYEDAVDISVHSVLDALYYDTLGYTIIIMSGRSDECRDETERWLYDQGIPYHHLYMRPEGDNRPDWQVKYDLFNEHVRGAYNIEGVFDDRISVLKLWEGMGLSTFRVGGLNGGDF